MRFQPLFIAILVIAMAAACKESEDPSPTNGTGSEKTSHTLTQGDGLVTFDPELLRSSLHTMDNMVLLPPERDQEGKTMPPYLFYLLKNNDSYTTAIRIAVECTTEGLEELTLYQYDVEKIIGACFITKTADYLVSVEGKLELKEEIIQRLRYALPTTEGIKEVYFQTINIYEEYDRPADIPDGRHPQSMTKLKPKIKPAPSAEHESKPAH